MERSLPKGGMIISEAYMLNRWLFMMLRKMGTPQMEALHMSPLSPAIIMEEHHLARNL
jgi:hypothetical protein